VLGVWLQNPLQMKESESEHLASLDWRRGKWADAKGKYLREHTLQLIGGAKIKACICWGVYQKSVG
jgi:hypothetical protein